MESLINNLLRPYRFSYSLLDLGKKLTASFERHDDFLMNDRDQKIVYSYFQHVKPSNTCIIYCHCNSGSRVEGLQYVDYFISQSWNVCLFDFSGSGLSEGKNISLGHQESKDLEAVVNQIRFKGNHKILLWGRSMGAATIIFYLSQTKLRQNIIGCVLDSPYASLWSLMKQIGVQKSGLPGFIIEKVIDFVRDKIKQQHHFDIKQLEPVKWITQLSLPILFITSLIDEFVKSEDVHQLFKNASSQIKRLQYIEKTHNSNRDQRIIQIGLSFLQKSLQEKSRKKKVLKIFTRNNKDITGNNMADLIIKAEKQKDQIRRMKSFTNFQQKKGEKDKSKVNKKSNENMRTEENERNYENDEDNRIQLDSEPPLIKRHNFRNESAFMKENLGRKNQNRPIKIHAKIQHL